MVYDWVKIKIASDHVFASVPYFSNGELADLIGIKHKERTTFFWNELEKYIISNGYKNTGNITCGANAIKLTDGTVLWSYKWYKS